MTWLLALLLAVSSVDAAAAARIARYRELPNGPLQFVDEQFHATPDAWQETLLRTFADPRPQAKRISLQACAGPGKTAGLAWCGWYFLATQFLEPGEWPKGLATAITGDNLRDNLWTEFSKWQERSPWLSSGFTWTATRIYANEYPQGWWLATRAWPKAGSADQQGRTLSGVHSRSVLFLVDESGAIPSTILRATEQGLTNTAFGKVLQAGNPISLEGMLYEAANRLREQWVIVKISGDPDDPDAWVNTPRIRALHSDDAHCACPRCWATQQIAQYGRDNPWVKAYILGQFPPASINALLGIEDVEAAIARGREIQPRAYEHMQRRLGVDVARFGDDRTVLFPRQGLKAFNPVVLRHQRTTDIAARIMLAAARWKQDLELIDDTGHWGHGVIDNLIAAGRSPHAVQYHAPALDPRFKNRRAEMWMTAAEQIKRGASLPDFPELIAEATTPTYTFVNGAFQLEDKALVKKRLGRSPDLFDAYALTYALPDMPRGFDDPRLVGSGAAMGHAATEYDPLARG